MLTLQHNPLNAQAVSWLLTGTYHNHNGVAVPIEQRALSSKEQALNVVEHLRETGNECRVVVKC